MLKVGILLRLPQPLAPLGLVFLLAAAFVFLGLSSRCILCYTLSAFLGLGFLVGGGFGVGLGFSLGRSLGFLCLFL